MTVHASDFQPIGERKIRDDGYIINEANGLNMDGSKNIKITGDPRRLLAFTTTTPLVANGSYYSPTIDGIAYGAFTGTVYSNVAGTLYFEHSDDGLNWNRMSDSITVVAGEGQGFTEPIYSQYIRLVYTNGATAQASFILNGYMKPE